MIFSVLATGINVMPNINKIILYNALHKVLSLLFIIIGSTALPHTLCAKEKYPPKWLFKSNFSECYRIPSLVSIGVNLIAVAERRHGTSESNPDQPSLAKKENFNSKKCMDWGYIDLVMRRSVDGGRSWNEQTSIVRYSNFLQSPFNMALAGNPTLLETKGKLILLFNVTRSSGEYNGAKCSTKQAPVTCGYYFSNQIWKIESSNLGSTWTSPELVDISTPVTDMVRVGPGHGIVLSNGDLLVPGYPWLLKSSDGGITWRKAATTRNSPLRGGETAAVEIRPGHVWALLRPTKRTAIKNRSSYPFRLSASSFDFGDNYETIEVNKAFLSPLVQAGLTKYGDRIVASYPAASAEQTEKGPDNESIRDRRNLMLSISTDDAESWKRCDLTEGAAGYSDIAAMHGGLALIYEGNIDGTLKDDPRQGVIYRFVTDEFMATCISK